MKQPHINCDVSDIKENVIVCGDPERVKRIAELGEKPEFISSNREFTVYNTLWKGCSVSVCSTGIGGTSALIAIEELIRCGAKRIIRVGSAGALQVGMKNGELIVAIGAVRKEGASKMYIEPAYPAVSDIDLIQRMCSYLNDRHLKYYSGIIYSHDSFYTDKEDEISKYWSSKNVLGADMETASILTLARLRGISAASILNVVVEYCASIETGINEYKNTEEVLANGERSASLAALSALFNT